jgi:hypothetical protein
LATVLGRAGFVVVQRGEGGRSVRALSAAGTFGAVVVAADLFFVHFPRDMNVPFPRSLAFYPAIAFLVEILFHVLPLSVALFPLALVRSPKARRLLAFGALAAAALLEPAYQVLKASGGQAPGTAAFVAVHVAAINVVGLWLFRRYDFLTMYGFRILYYLIWHVAWGGLASANLVLSGSSDPWPATWLVRGSESPTDLQRHFWDETLGGISARADGRLGVTPHAEVAGGPRIQIEVIAQRPDPAHAKCRHDGVVLPPHVFFGVGDRIVPPLDARAEPRSGPTRPREVVHEQRVGRGPGV